MSQISNLEKEHQIQPKASRCQSAEIEEVNKGKIKIERQETESWLFEKINKTDKCLSLPNYKK